jgi:cytochrome bd-type quinol oxidase subunit 2
MTFDDLLNIYKWLLLLVVLLFFVDNCLIYFANKRDISLQNRYYNLHKKIGVIKFTALNERELRK